MRGTWGLAPSFRSWPVGLFSGRPWGRLCASPAGGKDCSATRSTSFPRGPAAEPPDETRDSQFHKELQRAPNAPETRACGAARASTRSARSLSSSAELMNECVSRPLLSVAGNRSPYTEQLKQHRLLSLSFSGSGAWPRLQDLTWLRASPDGGWGHT